MVRKKLTRRNWLQKVGALSVVPASAITSRSDKTEKLPELRNQDGVVRYMEVPKEWVEHKRKVKEVRDQVEEEYLGREGVHEISMERAPETYGEKHGFEIGVGLEEDKFKAEIPDHIEGVRINTVENTPAEHVCYNNSYNDLPPGVHIVSDDSGTVDVGTTGWPVNDGSTTYMLTAYHVDHSGDVYGDINFGSVLKIGDIHDYDYDLDISLIDTSRSIETTIQGDGNTYTIGGWISESGIEDRVSNLWDGYRKMGSVTGETTGGLTACHVSTNKYSYNNEGVKGGARVADGDSGGPAFDVIQGEAYLEFLVSGARKKKNTNNCLNSQVYKKSLGPATYEIDNYYSTVNA